MFRRGEGGTYKPSEGELLRNKIAETGDPAEKEILEQGVRDKYGITTREEILEILKLSQEQKTKADNILNNFLEGKRNFDDEQTFLTGAQKLYLKREVIARIADQEKRKQAESIVSDIGEVLDDAEIIENSTPAPSAENIKKDKLGDNREDRVSA